VSIAESKPPFDRLREAANAADGVIHLAFKHDLALRAKPNHCADDRST
jgi:hypothetical protein